MVKHSEITLSSEELKQYQRQIILPEIGIEGQEKLKKAKVLCVGSGGLGSPILIYLAAAGVGTLGIIDGDKVDITNLSRQIIFSEQDIGQKKVIAARKRLLQLNKHLKIHIYDEVFEASNAEKILQNYDIVVDGSDNFSTKYLVNDAALKLGIPNVYASILGFEGRVTVFGDKAGPCYRCLYPEPPQHYIPNCAEFGILGALAGVIGCVQAMETIKWIINQPPDPIGPFKPLIGKLWTIDGRTMAVNTIQIKKRKNCATCNKPKAAIFLYDLEKKCASETTQIPDILAIEGEKYLNRKDVVFLDVRELVEWQTGHIANAIHWPLPQLLSDERLVHKLDPTLTYLVYCQIGKRSAEGASHLLKLGFRKVLHLRGGLAEWKGELTR